MIRVSGRDGISRDGVHRGGGVQTAGGDMGIGDAIGIQFLELDQLAA
jgi:hypothetical protein